MNLPDDYKQLFYSLVVLFTCYLLFLAFYVNEKARLINEKEKRAKRKAQTNGEPAGFPHR